MNDKMNVREIGEKTPEDERAIRDLYRCIALALGRDEPVTAEEAGEWLINVTWSKGMTNAQMLEYLGNLIKERNSLISRQ